LDATKQAINFRASLGLGLEKSRTLFGLGGKVGVATKLEVKVSPLAVATGDAKGTNVSATVEAGAKVSIPGVVEGRAQFKFDAPAIVNGKLDFPGIQDKSGVDAKNPETGARIGTATSDLTLLGASDNFRAFVVGIDMNVIPKRLVRWFTIFCQWFKNLPMRFIRR
jgi:hypothetical protein